MKTFIYSIWYGMISLLLLATFAPFFLFVYEFHRFPMGSGEVWNWVLGL
jgi:hypothetical protein